MTDSPLLRLEGLAFDGFGPIDLDVAADECVGLTGPSGCGKTRLLRAIADLDPHAGHAWLDDGRADRYRPAEWRCQVGLLPAESAWWHDRVGDHFAQPPDAERLRLLGFDAAAMDWRIDRLSSGEKQRLALLRLLAVEPRVLLLDEPTANLDDDNGRQVEALLLEYRRSRRAAILWVGHDARQLHRVATRCYRIVQGRLTALEVAA